jgi:dephospho-CoA kinase
VDRYLRIQISITVGEAQRIRRLMQRRSCEQESFGMIAEKETDLKMKRSFRPRWITIELFVDVKGMDVIYMGYVPCQ